MTALLQAPQARAGEFIRLRRGIHRHPERAFKEHRTATQVADRLQGWGWAVERGAGEGGCMVHNPGCDFNDGNIGTGSAYWVLLAERFLAAKGPASAS